MEKSQTPNLKKVGNLVASEDVVICIHEKDLEFFEGEIQENLRRCVYECQGYELKCKDYAPFRE